MAKRKKLEYMESYVKGTELTIKSEVQNLVERSTKIEILNRGYYDDGERFVTIKIITPKI